RSKPGAVLEDVPLVAERALRMVTDHYVIAVDGTRRIVRPDSLCVHGDGPQAVAIVRALRARFQAGGIDIAPFARCAASRRTPGSSRWDTGPCWSPWVTGSTRGG